MRLEDRKRRVGLELDPTAEYTAELHTRWFQFGAFAPLFRSHGQFPLREIYNLAAQSHVQVSFDSPEFTADVDATGVLRLLEAAGHDVIVEPVLAIRPLEGTVQLRAHGEEHRAVVTVVEGGEQVDVRLIDPAQGIAPGQAVVVYDGSRVVGSATIAATRRAAATSNA